MKKLEDFKSEINKCSKCGLCQSVCPVYKETGNDCAVSRGKFVMLDGILKGDLKLNKNIDKYLDLCLKCGKCKDFCPSSIDVCEIFAYAKAQYVNKTFYGKFTSFIQSKFVFNSIINFLKSVFSPLSRHFETPSPTNGTKVKLLYFKGCVNNVYPKVENALKKVLSNFDVEIIEKDFECCGLPFLSSGNMDRFIEAAQNNIKLINEAECDYIITDCASCESTLKSYTKYCSESKIEKPIINICEFISKQDKKFKFNTPLKITFHKPCHLENDDFLKPLIKNCENIEYIEMKDYGNCCGFAGEFAIKNSKISQSISKKKAQNIIDTKADYIVTTCPACIMGITQGLILNHTLKPTALNLIELLAKADEII